MGRLDVRLDEPGIFGRSKKEPRNISIMKGVELELEEMRTGGWFILFWYHIMRSTRPRIMYSGQT